MIGVSLGLRSLVIEPGAATVATPPGPASVFAPLDVPTATEPAAESARAPAGRLAELAPLAACSVPQAWAAIRTTSGSRTRRLVCMCLEGRLERRIVEQGVGPRAQGPDNGVLRKLVPAFSALGPASGL